MKPTFILLPTPWRPGHDLPTPSTRQQQNKRDKHKTATTTKLAVAGTEVFFYYHTPSITFRKLPPWTEEGCRNQMFGVWFITCHLHTVSSTSWTMAVWRTSPGCVACCHGTADPTSTKREQMVLLIICLPRGSVKQRRDACIDKLCISCVESYVTECMHSSGWWIGQTAMTVHDYIPGLYGLSLFSDTTFVAHEQATQVSVQVKYIGSKQYCVLYIM